MGNETQRVDESQFQRAEWRRMKNYWKNCIENYEQLLQPFRDDIDKLSRERAERSELLQRWLFDHFVMLNASGDRRTLTDIFAPTPQRVPPAGTGECCAPKLLQYAFVHQLKPLCMAEFWQGASPKMEVRHHGSYYPACRGKCKPVLEWMLGPLQTSPRRGGFLATPSLQTSPRRGGFLGASHPSPLSSILNPVYEDAALIVIDKPAGLLSVPGNTGELSVESLLREHYGEIFMVHRLDQDTSGLMVVAKSREAHRSLQRQFLSATEGRGKTRKEGDDDARSIHKMYIALLDGVVEGSGTIRLPLRPDIDDRPRQVVDYEHGKEAVTDYEVLSVAEGRSLVALTPHTGRTHQLRMHCAHRDGLNTPIVGDRLYGHHHDDVQRLCLHAARLSFTHPVTGQPMTFSLPPDFSKYTG
jgi:tRNA pseudouridine32 synthase/23S rRNA pseudouridine746 synthase